MKRLQDIAEYVDERISSTEIELSDYVTTDCLLQNKNGRTIASNLPPVKCNLIKYQKNDILIANIRPYLKKIWYADRQGGASADVLVFRAKTSIDPLYLYAVFLQDSFYDYVMRATKGSKMPRGDKNHIMNYIVHPVSGAEEKRIGQIISNINTKIELNKKISRELEAMAKELYDYWFVQFDFPNEQGKPYKSSGGKMVWNETLKREIPEGWGICKLKDYINNISRPTLAGEHLRDMFYTPIDELPKRQMSFYGGLPYTDAKSSLQLYQENDILIGAMRVYFHRVCIAAQRGITRSTTIVLQIRNVKDLAFIYELLNDDQTIQYANKISVGTQQPYVNWDNAFDSMDVILPMNLIITAFCKKINPVIDKVKCLAKENYTLTRLRDYLLPLLMNGQVKVSEEKGAYVSQKDDTNRFILWKNTHAVAARGEKNDTVLRAMYDAMDDEDK